MSDGTFVPTHGVSSSCGYTGTALTGASATAFTVPAGRVYRTIQVVNTGAQVGTLSPDGKTSHLAFKASDVTTFAGLAVGQGAVVSVHRIGSTTTGNLTGVFVSAW